jgi:hypothetical protein
MGRPEDEREEKSPERENAARSLVADRAEFIRRLGAREDMMMEDVDERTLVVMECWPSRVGRQLTAHPHNVLNRCCIHE